MTKMRWDYATEKVVIVAEPAPEDPNAPIFPEEDLDETSMPNHLLHELKLKDNGGIVQACKKADMWYPHVYRCLRNERLINVQALERLGAAVGMELVWRKKKGKRT